jgi:modulator of FtsH protease
MGNVYQPELWREAYVMLGTAAAALIGLLFVSTSLHLDEIVNNPVFQIRARNNMFYLMVLVAEATLILIPQSTVVLGFEFIAVIFLLLLLHIRNLYKFRYKNKEVGDRGGFQSYTTLRFITSDLLGIVGGIYLVKLSNWGLYLITASYVIFLASVIFNAWLIMLGVGQARKTTRAN